MTENGALFAELHPVAAGDRRVEHPEAVEPLLHLEVRPRHPVDQDDVAPQAGVAGVVVAELAVRGEHLVGQDQRQVVLVVGLPARGEVPLRDGQPRLDVVVQVVLRREPHVGVLRGVVHAVVVVPEGPRVLLVRVDVALGLADLGDVAGVPVVLRLRRRAVQVRRGPGVVAPERVRRGQLVGLHDRERRTALGVDRRPGSGRPLAGEPIAEDRGLVPGQDRHLPRALLEGDGAAAAPVDDRRDRERLGVGGRKPARRDLAHGLRTDDALEGECERRCPQRGELQHVPTGHLCLDHLNPSARGQLVCHRRELSPRKAISSRRA
jgi:hypothetical protein